MIYLMMSKFFNLILKGERGDLFYIVEEGELVAKKLMEGGKRRKIIFFLRLFVK